MTVWRDVGDGKKEMRRVWAIRGANREENGHLKLWTRFGYGRKRKLEPLSSDEAYATVAAGFCPE